MLGWVWNERPSTIVGRFKIALVTTAGKTLDVVLVSSLTVKPG